MNKSITLAQANELKRETEKRIRELIETFEGETRLAVKDIRLHQLIYLNRSTKTHSVYIEVELPLFELRPPQEK